MILRNLSPTGCGGKPSKQKKALTQMYPAVKTLAYSFYVTSLETTGEDLHTAFPQSGIKNKYQPRRCTWQISFITSRAAEGNPAVQRGPSVPSHRLSLLQHLTGANVSQLWRFPRPHSNKNQASSVADFLTRTQPGKYNQRSSNRVAIGS